MLNDSEVEQRVRFLQQLPWRFVATIAADGAREMSVTELPDFFYVVPHGMDEEAASADLLEAFEAFLTSYVEHEDVVSTPRNIVLPWSAEGVANRDQMVAMLTREMGRFTADAVLANPITEASVGVRTPALDLSLVFAQASRDLVPA